MALTPEDVVNKRFQPTKFREGYDQDEVDDFLDEVVIELRRLSQENEEIRQRLIAGEARINDLQRSGAAPSAPLVAQPALVAVPVAAPVPVPAPIDADSVDPSSANNLLQLARKLHEEHVREGIEKRDALIAEGNASAARVLGAAEDTQRQQLSHLEQERQSLQGRIDDLRSFEREYRQKLKTYIEGQLHELESPSAAVNAAQERRSEPVQAQPYEAQRAAPAYPPVQSAPQPAGNQGFGGN